MVLMAVNIKVTVFWDVTPCSLVDDYQHFEGTAKGKVKFSLCLSN
jgi:hypothetical protein